MLLTIWLLFETGGCLKIAKGIVEKSRTFSVFSEKARFSRKTASRPLGICGFDVCNHDGV